MSWTSDLLTGIAETLDAAGVGLWRPDGVYGPGEVGIYIAYMPPGSESGSPDRCIVLTDYDPNGGNNSGDVAPRVQVRCRGGRNDPVSVIDLASDARDALDGLAHVTWGQVEVSGVNHSSGVPLGVDGNGRHERSDNYDIQARRTSALQDE